MSDIFENILRITISHTCYESYPCQHDVIIKYRDGRTKTVRMSATSILEKFYNFLTDDQKEHLGF